MKYEFEAIAKIVLNSKITVSAVNYECALEQAKEMALADINNIPTSLGLVIEGELYDSVNDKTIEIC